MLARGCVHTVFRLASAAVNNRVLNRFCPVSDIRISFFTLKDVQVLEVFKKYIMKLKSPYNYVITF